MNSIPTQKNFVEEHQLSDLQLSVITTRAKDLQTKAIQKLEDTKKTKITSEEYRDIVLQTQAEQLKYIDEEFDKITRQILERKEALKNSYKEYCQSELDELEKETSSLNKSEKSDLVSNNNLSSKVIFDPLASKAIKNTGITTNDLKDLRICYFGEKNKILIYHIDRNEWTVTQLPLEEVNEFNYYSSAVTLPNGSVLIIGGGLSSSVYQIYFDKSHENQLSNKVRIIPKTPMNQLRKEHATIFLQDAVYVFGGYDGVLSKFLSSCERYDLGTDKWTPISSMLIPKCAFGVTTLANRYIFTFGGYDGHARLSAIEKYDVQTDKWILLDVSLKKPLSNNACFSYRENSIVILGGGDNNGFNLEVNQLNLDTNQWKQLPSMTDGRDLRNKLVSMSGNVYAVGGNNFRAEKYSLEKEEWQELASYKELVDDNLDSWSCALYYELPKKSED